MPATGDRISPSETVTRLTNGTTTLSADSSTWAGTESGAVMTVTVSLINGFVYGLTFFGIVSADVANDASLMRIREGDGAGTQITAAPVFMPTTLGTGWTIMLYAEYTAVATGSKPFIITGQRNVGTGTAHRIRASAVRQAFFTVDRIVS